MQDKKKLIESMDNLINHVSINRKNQQQIFATLSLSDFQKIIGNLQDSNQMLRKTTLVLIAELLYDNYNLQRKFTELFGIASSPGKIVLTGKFPTSLTSNPIALSEVVKILKDQERVSLQKGFLWYIDFQSKPVVLKMGHRNNFVVDPLQCIAGIWISRNPADKGPRLKSKSNEKEIEKRTVTPKKAHHIERKPDSRNNSAHKVRLNKSSHLYQSTDNKPEPLKNNFLVQSTKFRQPDFSEQNLRPALSITATTTPITGQYQRLIQTDKKSNYNSTRNDYSFTYIKPSLIESVGSSALQKPHNELIMTRWHPNRTDRK